MLRLRARRAKLRAHRRPRRQRRRPTAEDRLGLHRFRRVFAVDRRQGAGGRVLLGQQKYVAVERGPGGRGGAARGGGGGGRGGAPTSPRRQQSPRAGTTRRTASGRLRRRFPPRSLTFPRRSRRRPPPNSKRPTRTRGTRRTRTASTRWTRTRAARISTRGAADGRKRASAKRTRATSCATATGPARCASTSRRFRTSIRPTSAKWTRGIRLTCKARAVSDYRVRRSASASDGVATWSGTPAMLLDAKLSRATRAVSLTGFVQN